MPWRVALLVSVKLTYYTVSQLVACDSSVIGAVLVCCSTKGNKAIAQYGMLCWSCEVSCVATMGLHPQLARTTSLLLGR